MFSIALKTSGALLIKAKWTHSMTKLNQDFLNCGSQAHMLWVVILAFHLPLLPKTENGFLGLLQDILRPTETGTEGCQPGITKRPLQPPGK